MWCAILLTQAKIEWYRSVQMAQNPKLENVERAHHVRNATLRHVTPLSQTTPTEVLLAARHVMANYRIQFFSEL
jgi:hypothetical protein